MHPSFLGGDLLTLSMLIQGYYVHPCIVMLKACVYAHVSCAHLHLLLLGAYPFVLDHISF